MLQRADAVDRVQKPGPPTCQAPNYPAARSVSGGGVSRNTGFEVRRCVLRNSNYAGRGVTRICRQDRQGAEYNRWSEKMKEEISL